MPLSPSLKAGLSQSTQRIRSGNIPFRTYSEGENPIHKYLKYRSQNSNMNFLRFPADEPDIKIVLVARDYNSTVNDILGDQISRIFDSSGALNGTTVGGAPINATLGRAGRMRQGFILPIPQMSLIDRYQINYDDNASMLAALSGLGGRLIGNTLGDAISSSDLRNALTQTFQTVTGLSLNKFKSVLMEAPVLKTHEFVWKLAPKTQIEAYDIRNIVNRLKICMAPGLTGASLVLTFPYIFDIYYEPNSSKMYPFKPAVLRSLDVNYGDTAGVPAFYKDGFPEHIQITASFVEIEIWTREDYEYLDRVVDRADYNPVDFVRPIRGGFRTNDPLGQPLPTPLPQNARSVSNVSTSNGAP